MYKKYLSELSELISIGPIVVYTCEAFGDFTATSITPNIKEQLGYDQEEFLAVPGFWASNIHPDDSQIIFKNIDKLFDKRIHTHEYRFLHKDGSYRWMHDDLRLIVDDNQQPKLIVGYWADITEKKQLEAALFKAHEELELKVQERTAELTIARNEAEAANVLKSHLITTMSHELRTPLTSIVGSLRLLSEVNVVTDVDARQDLLNIAWRNSKHLTELVDDIIDTERLVARAIVLQKQTLDLTELMRDAVELNKGYANEMGATMVLGEMSPGVIIEGDRRRLLQVMANLISNASKFSHDGGAVTIDLIRNIDNSIIRVIDEGPGVPDDICDTIFDSFVRGENTDTRNSGGAGLGLSIAKSLVELHGGAISFETKMGVGTTFIVSLPVSE